MVLSRNQLTLHAVRRIPHVDSRLVLPARPVWSAKTRRDPSRLGRDARPIISIHYGFLYKENNDHAHTPDRTFW